MYVAFFLEVGLLLVVVPWSAFWERNYFAGAWPPLRAVLANHFVRGAVTGLGLVNLYAGCADLAQLFRTRFEDAEVRPEPVEGPKVADIPLRDAAGGP